MMKESRCAPPNAGSVRRREQRNRARPRVVPDDVDSFHSFTNAPMTRALAAIALLSFAAIPAAAQNTYAPPGDTLRFHETQKAGVVITMPQGEVNASLDQEATLAVHRMP